MIYLLSAMSIFFFVTFFIFLNNRKKLIDSISISIENYFLKYNLPSEGLVTVECLNMDAVNSSFSNKKLLVWNDGEHFNMVNSNFEEDLGIESIPYEKITKLILHKYPYSSKEDVFLTFTTTNSSSEIYFLGSAFDDLKSIIKI